MTEREKIIEILKQTSDIWTKVESYSYIVSVDLGKISDALIEAGIGDVTEWKHRAEVAERQAVLLSKWLAEKTRKDYPWRARFDEAQKQAEKEIEEEGKQ